MIDLYLNSFLHRILPTQQIISNILTAFEAITRNKLRSILTSLGIVFGVASVISMLAIGRGAQQEILDQMKLLGTNNIIITPIIEQEEGKADSQEENQKQNEKKKFTPGLTLLDGTSILKNLPHIESVSSETVMETMAVREGFKRSSKLVGVDSSFFSNSGYEIDRGSLFSPIQLENALPVAVIGQAIKVKFFTREDPIGKQIKCGKLWLTVVGVLKERNISKQNIQHLGLRDYNFDIYSPINTILLRYKNRGLVTRRDIQNASRGNNTDNADEQKKAVNYHQIDRIVVRVDNTAYIHSLAEVISRLLQRRHNGIVDFSVTVPEELLKQEQRTKEIFNIVLGAIASISLIVGGIGIMNIMLASVMERTKEIGIRRSVGATRTDIVMQFLSEATTISVTGGLIGIILGYIISVLIEHTAGIVTIISAISVFISFAISITIGITFGFFPAKRAADQDVIQSLRYE